jgi:predicted glycogen debranching enzyme
MHTSGKLFQCPSAQEYCQVDTLKMNLPTLRLAKEELAHFDEAIQKEWLITNGLGSYASSTVLGINTRKYHGLFVAALHPPGDRTVCFAKLDEEINLNGNIYLLGANEFSDTVFPQGYRHLTSFSVSPFPKYVYSVEEVEVEKTVFLPHEKNVSLVVYRVQNRGSSEVKIKLFPLVTCRHYHSVVNKSKTELKFSQNQTGIRELQLAFENPKAAITFRATSGEFIPKPNWIERLLYREDAMRRESSMDDCFQPGAFELSVPAGKHEEFAILAAAAESVQENAESLDSVGSAMPNIDDVFNRELERHGKLLGNFSSSHKSVSASDWLSWILFAADSFIVKGVNNRRAVIAGYHWYEPWGRDTFISFPGLMLVTGRFEDARNVLSNFSAHCKSGLIPNFLKDRSGEAAYNSVDASLWYVNAVLQYIKYTGNFKFVHSQLWESLKDIVESHISGTDFGIHMDNDGLIGHGPHLTWMDAEVNGKAITPRAGKAVEIQALWFNALKTAQLLATWFAEKNLAETYAALSEKVKASFNVKFWNSEKNCLFDVLGESGTADASVRPNQVIVAALDFTMLDNVKGRHIVDVAMHELLTPCGLRTLEPSDPNYKGVYAGDRWSRDQAYHNGSVWSWLLGPYTTAFLKTKGCTAQNVEYAFRNFLEPLFTRQIQQACLGTVNEIFDGDAPHAPKGCVAQAWSVAEPLRVYVEDVLLAKPKFGKEVLSV